MTFLPYPSFRESARCLDRQRLGKQRVEVLQILNALIGESGWRYHPAVAMWRGCERALKIYGIFICDEWRRRGYADTVRDKLLEVSTSPCAVPSWLGDERVHSPHRASLLFKNPSHYSQFGWKESPSIEYYWPVHILKASDFVFDKRVPINALEKTFLPP